MQVCMWTDSKGKTRWIDDDGVEYPDFIGECWSNCDGDFFLRNIWFIGKENGERTFTILRTERKNS